MPYEIVRYSDRKSSFIVRSLAAFRADVTLEFLEYCEQEDLIKIRKTPDNELTFDSDLVEQLVLIHRLQRDLALDMETIDLVLHMRQQIVDLRAQLQEAESRANQREQTLLSEIQALRRQIAKETG